MPALGSERSLDNLAAFRFGEMKFPDLKIGEVSATAAPVSEVKPQASPKVPVVPDLKALKQELIRFNKTALFKIVGNDKKVYGPVSGEMIEEWLADERIKLTSLAQKVGYKDWKPLAHFAESSVASSRPLRMK